jgi:hypothetical protein
MIVLTASLQRLSDLAELWKANGKPEQESFQWSKTSFRWQSALKEYAQFIDTLEPTLNRTQVKNIVCDQSVDIISRFIASMIWGYGEVGYGPFRVKGILSNPDLDSKLQSTFDLANQGYWLESYARLRDCKIKGLGPAYGTKWLFFCSGPGQEMPIYDSVIAKWIASNASEDFLGIPTSSEYWRPLTYKTYVEYLNRCARDLKISVGDIELLIYNDAARIL